MTRAKKQNPVTKSVTARHQFGDANGFDVTKSVTGRHQIGDEIAVSGPFNVTKSVTTLSTIPTEAEQSGQDKARCNETREPGRARSKSKGAARESGGEQGATYRPGFLFAVLGQVLAEFQDQEKRLRLYEAMNAGKEQRQQ